MTSAITRFQPEIPLTVPQQVVANGCWLNDAARRLGLHLMGAPGVGKSRLGGLLTYFDFRRGAGQVVLDATGGAIDGFLHHLLWQPAHVQEQLWPRIRYTDLGATDYVTPLPLYYRLAGDEPLSVTAGRYLEVIRRTDPYLQTASVEGWNALYETGIYAGMLAASVQGQITDLVDLIQSSEGWLKRYEGVLTGHPEVQSALTYFRFFQKLAPERQRRFAGSLLTKLTPFLVNPPLKALVSSPRPAITMAQVDDGHLTWLIDGRNAPLAHKQELLLWVFRLITDYLKCRGQAGRAQPLHFFVDELTQLLGFSSVQNEAMAEDLEELISVISRNYGCNLTIAHQSLAQINSERIRAALMSMGTQCIGRLSAPQDRLYMADQFLQYDPHQVKKEIPTYFNMAYPETIGSGSFAQTLMMPNPQVIDYTTEEYSIDEQRLLLADRFRNLDPFCFLVRPATAEGSVSDDLFEMTIEPFAPGRYPDPEQIAEARRQLRERDGHPVQELLADIEQKRQETIAVQTKPVRPKQPKPPATPSPQHGTLKSGDPADATNDSLSGASAPAEPAPAATGYRSRWQKAESS